MKYNEKTVLYGNFNITFGDKSDIPMLSHFEDIILPALMDRTLRKDTKGGLPYYYFLNICIKRIYDEFVLVGNFIKETQYEIHSIIKNEKIEERQNTYESAPYSRFMIFLKNHRMVLIKNEKDSPDIRNFNTSIKSILYQYTYNTNISSNKKLPEANVNIIGIPLKRNIKIALDDLAKIQKLRLRMFPLNNDIHPSFLGEAATQAMRDIESKTGNINFNSPENKVGINKIVSEVSGVAEYTITGINKDKVKTVLKNDAFNAETKIPIENNIGEGDDYKIYTHALASGVPMPTSEDNQTLYESKEKILYSYLEKLL